MNIKKNMEFQIYDWMEDNTVSTSNSDSEDNNDPGHYIINTFGRCQDGKSVYAKIVNFTPYFYILLPDNVQDYPTYKLEILKKKIFKYLKDNKKIYYKYKSTLIEAQLLKFKKAEGFTNDIEYYFIRLVFNNSDGMKKYKSFLENNDIMIDYDINNHKFKLYEANLPPMFRCFHIKEISGCAWISVDQYTIIEEYEKESYCDIELEIDWRYLNSIKKETNAPFRICSFDIECYSHDGEFPQAKRIDDPIIQIGATYTYLGESIPYRQYIACLNDTKDLDNVIVENFKSEKDLILGFLNEIIENDCDIITGYNIFYFDEKYIYDKCTLLDLHHEMSYLSKLKNYKCKFKEMELFTSALKGEIKFWETPGRVHIDLMKDVQKTENLTSYKLDYVASRFIRGEITDYTILENNNVILHCNTINDIYLNEYIHIEIIKGFISDEIGNKYLVTEIDYDNKKITVKGDDTLIDSISMIKLKSLINWSQAKDDLNAKDIFRLFKQTSDDRRIIAKYCIKDCKLINLLINKLEIITKNLEMANVCYVPLSYLFIRGQGIKSFSLCAKEFRKQKYLFPVLKLNKLYKCTKCNNEFYNFYQCPKCNCRKREEIEVESISYEGAIVFDPVAEINYEAIAVKDYMSLYPSSIMHKNMSHETLVEDDKYDNLPNVKYYNAQFKESDGTIKYCRYAQVDNKLGVIPSILDNLLKERKLIKKLMKNEKDPFKYKILDAKQYAIKITANSLYGQLGAGTSPVFKRDIAACTTSTGREMLIFAKKYDEEILPYIINSLKYFYKHDKFDNINKMYKEIFNSENYEETSLITNLKSYVENDINDIIFLPIVKYGDTDSIFSCYKFRENSILLNKQKSLVLWKEIIQFAKTLIEPFFGDKERDIFVTLFNKYYSDKKINDLIIPDINNCKESFETNKLILSLKDRIKIFLKEYMTESYLPWLYTLGELVEKDYIHMFDIKLIKWAEHLLAKIRLSIENLYENRKMLLIDPIMTFINNLFLDNNYFVPTNENIIELTELIHKNHNIYKYKECKILLEKTMKDKWIYSNSRNELRKIIIDYLKLIIINKDEINFKSRNNIKIINFVNFIIKIKSNNEIVEEKIIEYTDIELSEKKIKEFTKLFDEKYNKNNGAKTMSQIIEDFIEKDLKLSFNFDKQLHYNKVISFIKNNIINYSIQPRWDYDNNNNKIHRIDIYKDGTIISDKTLQLTFKMGELSGDLIKYQLPYPHNLEFEKIYYPFIILKKKKYVGYKWESLNYPKLDYMGIVLKRRDNAPIVKEICGNIINFLINDRNPQGAITYIKKALEDIFNGNYDIKYFLQSRTLKSQSAYKDWKKIAHVVLANKINERTPGEAPQSGDRIEYAVIKIQNPTPGIKLLQGDIIETPEYIHKNNLQVDYLFYLTNQIMNPALQFLELVDKDCKQIFTDFINKYGIKKIKKSKSIEQNIIEIKNIIRKINKKKLNNLFESKIKIELLHDCINKIDNII